MVTIEEIARSLGVSTATVSNVIHGNLHKMSRETAERVREKLEEYDYIPNMGARMLAKGGSEMITVITNYPNYEDRLALQDPFVSEIIASLENEIRSRGYYMMLYAAQTAAEINKIAQSWNTLGLIVIGLHSDQCRELVRAAHRPAVFIDCYFDFENAHNNVGLEDERGGYLITEYLLKQGHRDIAFVCDVPEPKGVDAHRLKGHIAALRDHGITWNPERILPVAKDRRTRLKDYERMLVRIGHPDSALLFLADYYAVEAMGFLQGKGYRIPQDVSITGFDDNYLAQLVQPRLTTVRQRVPEKGKSAVKLLLKLLRKPDMPAQNIILPVTLVKGATVRRLAP